MSYRMTVRLECDVPSGYACREHQDFETTNVDNARAMAEVYDWVTWLDVDHATRDACPACIDQHGLKGVKKLTRMRRDG